MSMKEKNKGVKWYHVIDLKSAAVVLVLLFVAITQGLVESMSMTQYDIVDLADVPAYAGQPYVEVDDNIPVITKAEAVPHEFEEYAKLDDWGRSGTAYACVSTDLMPEGELGDISNITPSGWVNHEYDFIEGGTVYERCQLIGYQLTGETDNAKNLITGTRYLMTEGIGYFENLVAGHIQENEHHVLYRVHPVFQDEELVCRGVQMEIYCVECGNEAETDEEKFMYNVFCYNVQPGVEINYLTGENTIAE